MIKNYTDIKEENRFSRRIPVTSKLSPADLEVIQPKATAAKKTISSYLRDSALGSTVQASTPIPEICQEQWRELSRVAANLNQIAHHCNSGETHASSARVLEAVEKTFAVLVEVRASLLGMEGGTME